MLKKGHCPAQKSANHLNLIDKGASFVYKVPLNVTEGCTNMYAIIKTGAKQHKVSEGDVLLVEKIADEKGSEVVFEEVLMVAGADTVKIGKPFVEGAKVVGEIVAQTLGPKIVVGKMKRRKGYRKKTGHRQQLTSMKITKISV